MLYSLVCTSLCTIDNGAGGVSQTVAYPRSEEKLVIYTTTPSPLPQLKPQRFWKFEQTFLPSRTFLPPSLQNHIPRCLPSKQ